MRTKDERDFLHDQIPNLEAALFRADPHATERILSTNFPEHTANAMRNILHDPQFKNNPEDVRKFFHDLQNTIGKMAVLKLGIAFKPTEGMIAKLHEWTDKNLGPGIVLDISYDALMLGGARIIFGGRYKEMTLAQMITDTLAKEKTAILGMIK